MTVLEFRLVMLCVFHYDSAVYRCLSRHIKPLHRDEPQINDAVLFHVVDQLDPGNLLIVQLITSAFLKFGEVSCEFEVLQGVRDRR